jgi:DNA-binding NtrC family response regulator
MVWKPYDESVETAVSVTSVSLRPRVFVLAAVGGPDAGKSFTIDVGRTGRVLLGKSPACTVQLEDQTVSRRHAAFDVVDGKLRLTDLGSTNGTFVNGVSALEVALVGGETIQVGADLFRLEPGDEISDVTTESQASFGRLLGASPEIRRLYPTMRRIAASDIPVVIEGETGTGKEVLAEALHEQGARAAGPFVVFDCTTVAANFMEAVLFGHERGSFTGAIGSSPGLFEQADKGTLFIDEIGDLDLALQPKLLRAIERAEVRRIGGRQWLGVNVRVLAATRRNLDREVQAGRFRDDLFFRLAVGRVELPPLRHRRKDIGVLAAHFWNELGGNPRALTPAFLASLEDYDWPGNVRELRNAIARRIALGDPKDLEVEAEEAASPSTASPSGDVIQEIIDSELPFPIARDKALAHFEQRYVAQVLSRHAGNVTRAAEASGVGRRYFQTIRGRHTK